MKKKIFFITSLIFFVMAIILISMEVFSILLIKKMGYNWDPAYLRLIKGYKQVNLYGGLTEYHSWGQWGVPNYEGRVTNNCIDVKYKFNSHGARDKERSITGKNRTVVLGDSFTEGWGVDQDKSWPAYLEKISGKEFLNFGLSGGFSVLNEYILYKDFAQKFEHDAVMVGLTIGNDFTDNDPLSWLDLAKTRYFPFWKLTEDKKDFEIVYLAPKVEGKYVPGLEPKDKPTSFKVNYWRDYLAFLRLSEFIKDHKVYFDKDSLLAKKTNYNLPFSEDQIAATLLIYERLAELAQDKKKYVVILPSAPDVYFYKKNDKKKFPKFAEFKQRLRNQGWKIIDAMDVFSDLPIADIPSYYICDGHMSKKGNELVAQYIYRVIR